MGGIFVSYRRDDAKHAAGRLVDRLGRTFHSTQLFLDIDNIAPGVDFVEELSKQVHRCDVLLAIIGPSWIESRDAAGIRRLDNPADFVRIEIEAALTRQIRVIPVLVDGAAMPSEKDLPPSLRPMTTRNAVRLVHERFAADAEDLTRALTKVVTPDRWGWTGFSKGKHEATASRPGTAKVGADIHTSGAAAAAHPMFDAAPHSMFAAAVSLLKTGWRGALSMAALGVVSGMLSVAVQGSKPDLILWYHDTSPLAGLWFGLVIAFGAWRWGRVPLPVSVLLIVTTHAAWQLSAFGSFPGGGVLGLLSWGGTGALLTWIGAALFCPPMRNVKWAAACGAVGAVALYLVLVMSLPINEKNAGLQSVTQLLTNGYSFWQSVVAAVFGLFWSRTPEQPAVSRPARAI